MISDPDELHTDEPSTNGPGAHEQREGDVPSKSGRKREAEKSLLLARQLLQCAPSTLKSLQLEPSLANAVKTTKAIKSHGARKRQLQYLARLLRESEETENLLAALEQPSLLQARASASGADDASRVILTSLLTDFTTAVDTLQSDYPAIDHQQVRQIARQMKAAETALANVELTDKQRDTQRHKHKRAEKKLLLLLREHRAKT